MIDISAPPDGDPPAWHHNYHSADRQTRRIKIVSLLPHTNLLLLELVWAPIEPDYSSNPTQCVRFSMLPRFCASSIFCVIQ